MSNKKPLVLAFFCEKSPRLAKLQEVMNEGAEKINFQKYCMVMRHPKNGGIFFVNSGERSINLLIWPRSHDAQR